MIERVRPAFRGTRFGLAEAELDALEAFQWYETQGAGLGFVFRTEVDDAVRQISEAPMSFAVRYRNLRCLVLNRFPYGVYYRIYPDLIAIVGVVHGKRHPTTWQTRQ